MEELIDRLPHDDYVPLANLAKTALSHVYNLYFVAYGEDIHVYRPRFPTQSLPDSPCLIIDTPPSEPNLRGYINSRRPHAINNLIVQRLGREEALAVVRDDGDVDAYFTRHINQAIKRHSQPGNTLGVRGADLKCFFQRNVGKSAWGLAIHSEARMIAVSSNNLEVTVFTFALAQRDDDESFEDDSGDDEQIYYSGSGLIPPPDRKRDDTRIIANGKANIPNIAFCNTGHDPTGRWLISTDITGLVRSWDIHKLSRGGAVLATVHPSSLFVDELDYNPTGFDRHNAGWSIMFLDPNSFRHTRTVSEAFGVSNSNEIDPRQPTWDLSSSIEHVQGNATVYEHPTPAEVVDGDYSNPLGGQQTMTSTFPNTISHTRSPPPRSNRTLRDLIGELDTLGAADTGDVDSELLPATGADESMNMDSDDDDEIIVFQGRNAESANQPSLASQSSFAEDAYSEQVLDDDEVYHEPFEDEDNLYHHESPYPNPNTGNTSPTTPRRHLHRPQVRFQGTHSLCARLPCPILHASVTNLYLFQPAISSTSAQVHAPVITLSEPFEQDLPIRYYAIDALDRCNMSAAIPALGIVVIATQKGRCAILSLTQVVTRAPDLQPHGASRAGVGVTYKRVFGYRIDHILPFASQEAAGHRPPAPLHGIAVSPLQKGGGDDGGGHVGDEGGLGQGGAGERWRLMLMYQDHTVLSYEIGRAPDVGGGDEGVASVVI